MGWNVSLARTILIRQVTWFRAAVRFLISIFCHGHSLFSVMGFAFVPKSLHQDQFECPPYTMSGLEVRHAA